MKSNIIANLKYKFYFLFKIKNIYIKKSSNPSECKNEPDEEDDHPFGSCLVSLVVGKRKEKRKKTWENQE